MHPIDLTIFVLYVIGLLAFGYFFFRKNETGDDYYVGGRKMKSYHVGLSVVATDVGGGFSIGLGGLGFVMGISGSWMLFTGLVGAWLAAVFLIPKVKGNPAFDKAYTFPQLFNHYYTANVAFVAAIISAIGYMGFTSSQMLAGAKLASGTFADLNHDMALYIMGAVAVLYTVLGGLKAVIYTDTIQWTLLMFGLIFIGIPFAYIEIGGMEAIRATVPPEMLSLTNVSWQDLVYWSVTIIPIWFVGMTLYQRIYACHDEKTAKKAWYIAGVFEWPIMAFLGVLLGLFARVAADQGMFAFLGAEDIAETDPETGMPMLLRTVLPVGFLGIMMAAYFSAILSTADSCLMASSGNVVTDIIGRFTPFDPESSRFVRLSQVVTLIIGAAALFLAGMMTNVLDLMLASYAFMVSGLFVPVIGALYWKGSTPAGAMTAMIVGGFTTLYLSYSGLALPYDLDPNVFGITASAISFIVVSYITRNNGSKG
ncbi:MAG: sodium:solute symporter family protein [Balneolaceae bacterium]|nr:sodium:solute symporter family protein [Balneolaceae bacterium]MCH8549725.1 sodium:solute symporter family protein [Balneolaceae bacterium]